ncbi:MAG: hypothetical protein H7Z43_02925 [Clostridia bacterium]|nr:hypothetical protein [Deltaproteobacteria bacterium]
MAIAPRVLGIVMLLTVGVVVAAVWWDEQLEAKVTIEALSQSQLLLARSLARSQQPLDIARGIEIPGELIVLIGTRGSDILVANDGRQVQSTLIGAALRDSVQNLIVPRDDSTTFALPKRRSIAAIAPVADSERAVVVVSTAKRERDRQMRASTRVVGAVVVATLIVMGFASVALRGERRRFMAMRDAQLLRADKMATVAALAGGIAHEIATPLGVIAQRADQLATKLTGDERGAKAVAAILEQTARIERVMRGFLALARGEGAETVAVSIATIVRDAAELVAHRFQEADVSLSLEVASDMPCVLGDPVLLTHALVNLLLNACEASAPGTAVQLEANAENHSIRLSVRDQGRGIDAQTTERLREPFFTTKARGTGLGLAIAREVVGHHGGVLRLAANTQGPGTQAVIMLPAMLRVGV